MLEVKEDFIQTNDRIVSLNNTSNINVLKKDRRIVFNLSYPIEIVEFGNSKLISDYVYWDFISDIDYNNALKNINNNNYINNNYIEHNNGFINKNKISSIKFSDKKMRVIFNLSHQITYYDMNGTPKITSEFVYVDFNNAQDYRNYVTNIKNKLI